MKHTSIKVFAIASALFICGLLSAKASSDFAVGDNTAEPRFVSSQIINPELSLRSNSLLSDLNFKVDQLKQMGITFHPEYDERDLISVWGLEPILAAAPLGLMMIYGQGLSIESPNAIANVTAIPLHVKEFTDESYPVWFKKLASAAGLKSQLSISKSLMDQGRGIALVKMKLEDAVLEVSPVIDGEKVDASVISTVAVFVGDHVADGVEARFFVDEYFAYWYFLTEEQEKKIEELIRIHKICCEWH